MDWSVYNLIDEFTLYDAGFLLCDLKPLEYKSKYPDNDPYELDRKTAKMLTNALVSDIKEGRLEAHNSKGEDASWSWRRDKLLPTIQINNFKAQVGLPHSPEMDPGLLPESYFFNWRVFRDDLKTWAESKGKRPAFLFPENRKSEKETKIQSDNLKKALVCLAIDGYGYDPEDKKSPIPKQLSDVCSGCGFEISDKTIRNWLNEGKNLLNPIKT